MNSLLVTLSHCDKLIFFVLLSHRDKQHLYTLPKKIPKCSKNAQKNTKGTKSAKKCKKYQKVTKSAAFLALFGIFFWNIYKVCLLQWLSATNKKSVCRSDSVQQTKQIFFTATLCNKQYWEKKNPISLWHVTKELKKKQKNNILSYLNFTTAIKLLWGTFSVKVNVSVSVNVCLVSMQYKN